MKKKKPQKISIKNHFRKLIFFNFHRFKKDNYRVMREYFAQVFLVDIEKFIALQNKNILDIGGAEGEFCKFIADNRKCYPINLDPFPKKPIWKKTIKGYGHDLPFNKEKFDIVLCRGVFEHIPYDKEQKTLNESFRVLKEGGYGYFVVPPWYNPHAGHSFKPFHIFPFKIGKFLRELVFREKVDRALFTNKKIKGNCYEDYLIYKVTFSGMQRMLQKAGFEIVDTLDTHFRLHFMTKIPLLQEILVPAVAFIVRKP